MKVLLATFGFVKSSDRKLAVIVNRDAKGSASQ